MKRMDYDHLFEQRDDEYRRLETMVGTLREESAFLNKVLRTPELLTQAERERLVDMITTASLMGGSGTGVTVEGSMLRLGQGTRGVEIGDTASANPLSGLSLQ